MPMNICTPLKAVQVGTYLHLLKKTLTRFPLDPYEQMMVLALGDMEPALIRQICQWVVASRSVYSRSFGFNPVRRSLGMDLPGQAETMIGLYRLSNLEHCIISVLWHGVPGDLAEVGVWRGGATIFMRAVLKAYGDVDRKVWLVDSFQGFPKPDAASYPADRDNELWALPELAVSLETVKANLTRYGLMDDQVCFLPGWFHDTLPAAPIDRLAALRVDGGTYESTIIALRSLYHKVSPGGFVILDDYGAVDACRQAVNDFRAEVGIVEPLCPIDWTGVYWQAWALPKSERKK